MESQTHTIPQAIPPALLARLVEEVDRARGADLAVPMLRLTLLSAIPAVLIGWMMQGQGGSEVPTYFDSPFYAIPAFLVIAPALETVIMRVMFSLVGRLVHEILP